MEISQDILPNTNLPEKKSCDFGASGVLLVRMLSVCECNFLTFGMIILLLPFSLLRFLLQIQFWNWGRYQNIVSIR